MSAGYRIKSTKTISFVISLLAFCLFSSLVLFTINAEYNKAVNDKRTALLNDLTAKRALIENALNERLHIVSGLEAFVLTYPNFTKRDFSFYAQKLMGSHTGIRALQLAPGGIVKYVYPLKGNEVVNQLNLLEDPARKEAALRAIQTRKFVIAGPYVLKQGGFGFAGRLPIFFENHFWGFATIVMNLEPILKESGIINFLSEYEYAIKGKDGLGNSGEIFFGEKDIFSKNNLSASITLPNGKWIISARLKNDPGGLSGLIILLIILGTVVSFLVGYISFRISENFFNIKTALDENIEKYKVLFNTLPLGITIFDTNGNVIERNEEAETILGIPKGEIVDKHVSQAGWKLIRMDGSLMPKEEFPSNIAIKTRHKTEPVELGIQKDDGTITWLISTSTPFQVNGLGAATIYADVTRKVEAEKELLVAKEMAEESSKLKSILLANLNHEFRTPLTGILGLSALLRDELKDSEQKQMAQNIIKSGNRLLKTLTSILDLSELEAGRKSFTFEEVQLNHEITLIVEAFKSQAEQNGLCLNFLNDRDFIVSGSRDFIRQIIINLIDNAIKYTPEGRIDISLSSVSEGGKIWVIFSISDTGIGICKSQHELIFKEFRQASEGLNRTFEGSGLGLSIARKMAEAMNGKICVESEPGKGSVFSVYLPLISESIENNKLYEKLISARDSFNSVSKSITNLKSEELLPNILLVEDNFINKEVVCLYLREICKVDHARDGITSVKMAEKTMYRMVLMDINLGAGINGIEAAQKIKNIPGYEDIPIIAITGYSMKSEKEELLKSGLTRYLSKPFEKSDLIKIVKEILQEKS